MIFSFQVSWLQRYRECDCAAGPVTRRCRVRRYLYRVLWGRVFDRPAAASVNRLRYDGMRDRASSKGRHHPRHPRRAGVCRTIYRAPLGSQQSRRGGPGRSTVQLSEKRLARILLLLANFGKEGRPEPIIAKISQETLAEMIGTTRSRVSFFMNKFRELGLIDTTAASKLTVPC